MVARSLASLGHRSPTASLSRKPPRPSTRHTLLPLSASAAALSQQLTASYFTVHMRQTPQAHPPQASSAGGVLALAPSLVVGVVAVISVAAFGRSFLFSCLPRRSHRYALNASVVRVRVRLYRARHPDFFARGSGLVGVAPIKKNLLLITLEKTWHQASPQPTYIAFYGGRA